MRGIGSPQLLHLVPGSIYYYCKSPKPASPSSLYKTYRKTFLKGLARGLWCHDNSPNYRWFPAFDTMHRTLRTAAGEITKDAWCSRFKIK